VIEVYPGIHVGTFEDSTDKIFKDGWAVLSAAKEPYHRQLLGYTSRGAPKDHPDYYLIRKPNWLILNLVDANDVAYIPHHVILEAVKFIHNSLNDDKQVLAHCNEGKSRAPSIVLLYLSSVLPGDHDVYQFIQHFASIYPDYDPNRGMADYVLANFDFYKSGQWRDA